MAAKLPAAPDHNLDLRRGLSRLGPAHGPGRQAAAEGDERRLGSEDSAEAERCERRERDAGQFPAGEHAARLEAIRR